MISDVQTITSGSGSNNISYYYQKNAFNLTVDPAGGTWRGNATPTSLDIPTGDSQIIVDPIASVGATVTLYYHDDAAKVLDVDVRKEFSHWTKTGGGTFNTTTKEFTSGNGDALLNANYTGGSIKLPVPSERAHYTFIGWDTDPDISRVLSPHEPVFENGEKGVLQIELVGFVNKVEVTFPYELSRYDDTLDQVYTLTPQLTDSITQEFYIPLDSTEGEYRITVTAYNEEGDSLTVYPNLTIVGTILDDFRTRLR